MKFSQFQHLVDQGENSHVDFKLTCNAFNRSAGDQEKAKAELVKDICAMANNGTSTSYLLIGVGDDRKTVQSVTDAALNSQNIQTLVRDAIHPRPTVKVHRLNWADAPAPFSGAVFVAIQIGPNPRHAYRLARDFINWQQKIHFRKHEVWIRNQDTSDLATPEQLVRLIRPRRATTEAPSDTSFTVIEYQKLPQTKQQPALAKDVREFLNERGAMIADLPPEDRDLPEYPWHFRARLSIRNKPFVFRCIFVHRLASQSDRYRSLTNCWMCEHGVLIFVLGTASAAGKFRGLAVDSQEAWGSFGLLVPKKSSYFGRELPTTFVEAAASVITLPKLKNTADLRETFAEALKTLGADDALFEHLDTARGAMNKELRRWGRKSPSAVAKSFDYSAPVRSATFTRHVRSTLKLLNTKT